MLKTEEGRQALVSDWDSGAPEHLFWQRWHGLPLTEDPPPIDPNKAGTSADDQWMLPSNYSPPPWVKDPKIRPPWHDVNDDYSEFEYHIDRFNDDDPELLYYFNSCY